MNGTSGVEKFLHRFFFSTMCERYFVGDNLWKDIWVQDFVLCKMMI